MRLVRSWRPWVAAVAVTALVVPATAGAHGAAAAIRDYFGWRVATGTVQSMSVTASPALVTLQTSTGETITVTVPGTTTVLRRFNGLASLDEVSPGDRVSVLGTPAPDGALTISARYLKDWSIQEAFTLVAGRVVGVNNGTATLQVLWKRAAVGPYKHGTALTISIAPTAVIMSAHGTAALSDVRPGRVILAWGRYNRVNHTLLALRVRIVQG